MSRKPESASSLSKSPLRVVFLWHMHQPYYVDPLERVALMPWVRLHAVKGYLDMIDVLDAAPNVRASFNFTPVLLRQLEELANGSVRDLWGSWARTPAADLDGETRARILENFFKINHHTLIHPFPRYRQLLELRGREGTPGQIRAAARAYTTQDFLDLQTWYNLAWCGFSALRRYPELAQLRAKGTGFTEKEKNRVLDIHAEIVALLPGLYRDAAESGRIEITTTPFFHPILPLVFDSDFAKRAMPGRELPARFQAPEDAAAQLRLAQEQHTRVFGRPARGLWPSEGSVAPELLPLFRDAGIEYFCTDEDNLFRSLAQDPARQGRPPADHLELFQPWICAHEGAEVGALFRERPLSDFIGFNAARNTAADSADYLVHHLAHLAQVVPHAEGVVTLALDGENAWEAFSDGGEGFLRKMYQAIDSHPALTTATFGDIFDHPAPAPRSRVETLHTGSWIGANFDIWIGDSEENTAWERIAETRATLVEALAGNSVDAAIAAQAWDAIYAAEGSDWFWWYGPDFQTDCDMLFDLLFRKHLQRVHLLLGRTPPASLDNPIQQLHEETAAVPPRSRIRPEIGGIREGYYEWMGAGHFDVAQQQTAMFQSDRRTRELFYGFDGDYLFLRADFIDDFPQRVEFRFSRPSPVKITATREKSRILLEVFKENSKSAVCTATTETRKKHIPGAPLIAWEQRLECAVSFRDLGWKRPIPMIGFHFAVVEKKLETERHPERGEIEFSGPCPAFDLANWFV